MHNYLSTNSVFPLGSFKKNELITPCGTTHEQSFLVGLAPYYEQAQVFNAYNFSLHVYDYGNQTVHGVGISTLWCPSDPKVSQATDLTTIFTSFQGPPPFPFLMHYNSYKGNSGTWFSPGNADNPGDPNFSTLLSQSNGLISFFSRNSIASVTDGTSNTLLFAENAYGKLGGDDAIYFGWWTSGDYGDTMFTTFYPINPQNKVGLNAEHDHRLDRRLRIGRLQLPSRRNQCGVRRRVGAVHQGLDQHDALRPVDRRPARDHRRDDPVLRGLGADLLAPTRQPVRHLASPLDPRGGEVISADSY